MLPVIPDWVRVTAKSLSVLCCFISYKFNFSSTRQKVCHFEKFTLKVESVGFPEKICSIITSGPLYSMCGCDCAWRHTTLCLYFDVLVSNVSYECGCSTKKMKYSPMRPNSKQIKLVPEWEWISVWLSDTLEHRGETCRVGLLCNGQVGAKHRQLAC